MEISKFELNLYGIEIGEWGARYSHEPRFELNLYGIEINSKRSWGGNRSCLNWTFMELKWHIAASEIAL